MRRGYGHTLREISQQPLTWIETADRVRALSSAIAESLAGVSAIVLTGSGSSFYAAECVAPSLQRRLSLPVSAVPAGLILTHPQSCLPPSGPFLLVSLARSGDSPESRAAVDSVLEFRPQARHLFITCNSEGALATSYRDRPGIRTIVLDEKTDDRSLVMTSSFTNLVLAGHALAGGAAGDGAGGAARTRGWGRPVTGDVAPWAAAPAISFIRAKARGAGCSSVTDRSSATSTSERTPAAVRYLLSTNVPLTLTAARHSCSSA